MELLFILFGAFGVASASGILDAEESENDIVELDNGGEADTAAGNDLIEAIYTEDTAEEYDSEETSREALDVDAGEGDDTVTVDNGYDIDGEEIEDSITTGEGNDTVVLTGDFGSSVETVDLGAGDDTISVGFGSEVESLTLGAGADTLSMDGIYTETEVEDFDTTEDVLVFDLGLSFLNGDDALDYVNFSENDDGLVVSVEDPDTTEIYTMVTLKGLTMEDIDGLQISFN